jgi:hypothetical protein
MLVKLPNGSWMDGLFSQVAVLTHHFPINI